MSTLRNTHARRNHKERAQPLERQKWGILEKRKDYKLRAADHKTKARKLKALQQKATERNEDEFYFGMLSSKTQGGVRVAERGQNTGGMSMATVGLMKTQDVGYLRTVLQQTRRERERVERAVMAGETGVKLEPAKSRVVFGEDGEDVVAKPVVKADEMDGWSTEDDSDADSGEEDAGISVGERRKRKKLEARRKKLRGLEDREKQLAIALRAVEDQRARMNGTAGGVNKNGVKFKVRERRK